MLIPRILLVPSSPTLLIDERRGNSTAMLAAMLEAGARLESDLPEVLVVVTSRWASGAAFQADTAKKHTSLIDMPGFGVEPRYDCVGEPRLARAILDDARRAGLRAAAARRGADSGVSVPLHFLAAARLSTVVPVSVSDATPAEHRAWGECLRRAMTAWNGRAALIVSGALTFHEHSFNLKREIAEDRDLDAAALEALKSGAWSAIEALRPQDSDKLHPAAGWKHLDVLRGFLRDDLPGQVWAYEALPGIGEALVEFELAAVEQPAAAAPAATDASPTVTEPAPPLAAPSPPAPGTSSTP